MKTRRSSCADVRYLKVEASLVIAEIEMPDLGRTLVNCSSVSLSALAQDLDLHLVSQIQRIAEMGWLRPVHDVSLAWRDGLIATKRRYAAPAAMVTVPLLAKIPPPQRQQSPQTGVPPFREISRGVALRWAWPGAACKSRGSEKPPLDTTQCPCPHFGPAADSWAIQQLLKLSCAPLTIAP